MRVVAFGGGHGLSASLRALRQLPGLDLTAVVTVADDGGSSGRLRAERGVLPPGDLRQALPRWPATTRCLPVPHGFSNTDSAAPTRWPGTRSATWCCAG